MNQIDLTLPPASHRHDPETSKRAERRANISGQALQVYDALLRIGPCAMFELSERTGLDYFICQRRISVIEKNDLAERIGTTVNPTSGNKCCVWAARKI